MLHNKFFVKYNKYKKQYQEAKILFSESKHFVIKEIKNNKELIYFRASILILEEYYTNNTGRSEPALIMLNDSNWNNYVEPGGRIENNDNVLDIILKETAARELQEETMNTFFMNKNNLNNVEYVDFYDEIYKKYGRTFVICIQGGIFDEKIYYHNKKIINKSHGNNVWKETNEISRFYLSDIYECLKKDLNKNVLCKDAHGETHKIYNKTAKLIKLANDNDLFKNKKFLQNIMFVKLKNYDGSENFLQNTKTYEIIM